MNRCREEMNIKEDFQLNTSIYKSNKFKPINQVQWSKEFENYSSQYKTARITEVMLSYVIRNNVKRFNTLAMRLLPKSKHESRNITLNNRNSQYLEDSNQVY